MMEPNPEIAPRKFLFQARLTWVEVVILLTAGISLYLNGLLEIPFHVDETFWMSSSVRWDAWMSGDLEHEVWTEGYDTYEVRPIPSYAVAISQRAAGIPPDENPLSFSESWEEYAQGTDIRPADNILLYARLPMALTAAVSIVLISLFLARQRTRLTGYLFFAFSFNAYFMLHLRRAMTESILVLFTVLILVATPQLLSAIWATNTRGVVLWSALIGVLGGLAGQSKLTGLGCLVVSLLAAHVVLLMNRRETGSLDKKHSAIVTLGMPAVSFAVFVAVYPFFYTSTIERIFNTLVYRVGITRAQMETFDWAVVTGGRPGFLFERVYLDLMPESFRPLAILLAIFILGLTVYGIVLTINGMRLRQNTSPAVRNHRPADFYLVLALSALVLAGPMLLTPLDWRRYFIYPVFFSLVFAAIGLEGGVRWAVSKFN